MTTATKKKSKAKAKTKTMKEAKTEVAESTAVAESSTTKTDKGAVAKTASKAAEAAVDKRGGLAGARYLTLINGDDLEIPKFTDGVESQDAKGGYLIGCHIISRAKELKLDRVLLLDDEGNPITVPAGKNKVTKLSVWAYNLNHVYSVILEQTSTDLIPMHKANPLTSGIYRTSMPPTSMNNEEKTKNTYAKGGLFFLRSKSVGLKSGYIFSIPKYDREGHYKKHAPDAATLKAVCERFVSRVTK